MAGRHTSTADAPTLLGLLIDVSGSMRTSIRSEAHASMSRLQSVQASLDDLIARAAELSRDGAGAEIAPRYYVFAIGFGLDGPIARLSGRGDHGVRDLLELSGGPRTAPISVLANDWQRYRSHIQSLGRDMLGSTPMVEAFAVARERFRHELSGTRFRSPPILFVLSDGVPTDGSASDVVAVAQGLKSSGTLIVSCLLTDEDLTQPRTLYPAPRGEWSDGARLMFEIASPVPPDSPFEIYLQEYGWDAPSGSVLFSQINQSETLSEFLNVVVSPVEDKARHKTAPGGPPIRVFVSYSHVDSDYVGDDGLLGYLSGLEREGFEFWVDTAVVTGEKWDTRISEELDRSDIVLALVSQPFLRSPYCQDVEIRAALEARRDRGTVIYPIIVSPCDWTAFDWLASTQFQPRDKKTLEGDFPTRAARDGIYLEILRELRRIGDRVRQQRRGGR
jgi:hypothetical protein